jgi:hypothetical protein
MRYNNHHDMLPAEAFKTEFKGKIKPQGGGGSKSSPAPAAPTYDLYSDKGYIASQNFLDSLKGDIEKNNKRMTPEEIIAALTPAQKELINQQSNPLAVPDMSSWGSFNQVAPKESITSIIPQIPSTATGRFAGVQGVDPALMTQLQAMLGNSNILASIGGKK